MTPADIAERFPDTAAILSLLDSSDVGYIFEVNLRYPHHLHDRHSDYPLAPERLDINETMFSPFQRETYPKDKRKPGIRLTPNLRDKTNYVVHARNLRFYLAQGMELTRIHRVLTFQQSPWLKSYIDFNTQKLLLRRLKKTFSN